MVSSSFSPSPRNMEQSFFHHVTVLRRRAKLWQRTSRILSLSICFIISPSEARDSCAISFVKEIARPGQLIISETSSLAMFPVNFDISRIADSSVRSKRHGIYQQTFASRYHESKNVSFAYADDGILLRDMNHREGVSY